MNEKQDSRGGKNRRAETLEADSTRGDTSIGMGIKLGLYGCGFILLAILIVFVVLFLTGIYNPFQGTEGVGP